MPTDVPSASSAHGRNEVECDFCSCRIRFEVMGEHFASMVAQLALYGEANGQNRGQSALSSRSAHPRTSALPPERRREEPQP